MKGKLRKGVFQIKYLHIIPPSTRMLRGFMLMIQEYFEPSEHEYLFVSKVKTPDSGIIFCGTCHDLTAMGRGKLRKFFGVHNLLKQAEHIVFHCYLPTWSWLIMTWIHRKQLKDAAWVIWGRDLYSGKKSNTGLKNKLYNRLFMKCTAQIGTPIVLCEPDIPVYRKIYGDRPVQVGIYPLIENHFFQMDRIIQQQQKAALQTKTCSCSEPDGNENAEEKPLIIQVGHNALPANRHVDALKRLLRFRNENIRIFLPLAYGDSKHIGEIGYADAVAGYCRTYFDGPDMTEIQTDLIPPAEYKKRLAEVDIAIMNANRQSALGNILQLLYMGKKVFMARDNPLFSYLKDKGLEIYDVEEIDHMSFETFKRPVQQPFPHPWIRRANSIEYVQEDWKKIFAAIDNV